MPEMDGLEATGAICKLERCEHVIHTDAGFVVFCVQAVASLLHRSLRVRRAALPHTSPFSWVNWVEACG